jgi:hypothetical protein
VSIRQVVRLVDDLDGSVAAETVHFGIDGVSYKLDLSTANAAELRGLLGRYVAAGRRIAAQPAAAPRAHPAPAHPPAAHPAPAHPAPAHPAPAHPAAARPAATHPAPAHPAPAHPAPNHAPRAVPNTPAPSNRPMVEWTHPAPEEETQPASGRRAEVAGVRFSDPPASGG